MSPESESGGVDHRPTRLGGRLALLASVSPVVVAGVAGPRPVLVAVLGAVGTWVGLRRASRRLVTAATALSLAAVFLTGLSGVGAGLLLVGVAAAVGGWDVARNAIDLGDQVGRDAPSRGVESRHVVGTGVVALLAAALGYVVFLFRVGLTGAPVTALVLLALAALLVAVALD